MHGVAKGFHFPNILVLGAASYISNLSQLTRQNEKEKDLTLIIMWTCVPEAVGRHLLDLLRNEI